MQQLYEKPPEELLKDNMGEQRVIKDKAKFVETAIENEVEHLDTSELEKPKDKPEEKPEEQPQ